MAGPFSLSLPTVLCCPVRTCTRLLSSPYSLGLPSGHMGASPLCDPLSKWVGPCPSSPCPIFTQKYRLWTLLVIFLFRKGAYHIHRLFLYRSVLSLPRKGFSMVSKSEITCCRARFIIRISLPSRSHLSYPNAKSGSVSGTHCFFQDTVCHLLYFRCILYPSAIST